MSLHLKCACLFIQISIKLFKALKKKKKPPYEPEIPLLGTYPEEPKIEIDMCNPMFVAALFMIART